MKHTPGPWKATPWGSTISIDSPDETGVAFLNPMGNHDAGVPNSQDRANAHLIAAAPDMLDALELVYANAQDREETIDEDGQEFEEWKAVRRAITKAKGGKP